MTRYMIEADPGARVAVDQLTPTQTAALMAALDIPDDIDLTTAPLDGSIHRAGYRITRTS